MSHVFYWPVSKPSNETEEVLKWAKKYCPSYITNDVFRSDEYADRYYRFYFGNERDYVLCLLRWS